MSALDTARQFQTTSWTLIVRAGGNPAALEVLLEQYWSPIYAYLRRKGYQRADAADLTQAFIAKVVLDRHLIERADPVKGRFRSFLLTALRNFVIDETRQSSLRHERSWPAEQLDLAEPSEHDRPEDAFQRQYVTRVLELTLSRLEAHCRARGMERQWTVFDLRILRPIQQACDPVPFEELAKHVRVKSLQELYTMLQTMKRRFEAELRTVVADTVDDGVELVEAELQEVKMLLGVL